MGKSFSKTLYFKPPHILSRKAHRFARLMRFFSFSKINTTFALQAFQVMRLGAAVLTGVVLAKSGLTTTEIGTWELLLYLGTTFTFFWVNGLLQGIAPVYGKLDGEQHKVFIFHTFMVFCGIAFALFLLLVFGESWIVPSLTGLREVPFFKLFAWYLLFNLPAFPVEYYYLLHHKPYKILFWGIFSFGMQLIALFIPIWLGYGLQGGMTALIGLSVLRFIWAGGLALRLGKVSWDRNLVTGYLIFCVPLMLSNVVSNIMMLFDNWLVNHQFSDPAVFAIYRYGSREFPLAIALVSALGTSLIPKLGLSPEEGLSALKDKTTRLMHLLFPLTFLLLFASEWLFPRVFNPAFSASAPLFKIYLLTLASRIMTPGPVVLAKGESRAIFQISVAEMLVKICLGYCFIQLWGLPGLAWSVVLSYWVEKIGLIWVLEKKYHIPVRSWLDLKWYGFYTVTLFVFYWISTL